MNAFSKQQLQKLAYARKYPLSRKIGELAKNIIHELIGFYYQHVHENILAESIANRKKRSVPMGGDAYLNENYRQVSLQTLRLGGASDNRRDFNHPVSEQLVQAIHAVTGAGYRMRISSLQTGAEIPEHVDDPDQLRAIALLKGEQEFVLRTKSDTVYPKMQLGEVWYVNTAWPHRVRNPGLEDRLALLIDLPEHFIQQNLQFVRAGA